MFVSDLSMSGGCDGPDGNTQSRVSEVLDMEVSWEAEQGGDGNREEREEEGSGGSEGGREGERRSGVQSTSASCHDVVWTRLSRQTYPQHPTSISSPSS